jgi:hypothetical protein
MSNLVSLPTLTLKSFTQFSGMAVGSLVFEVRIAWIREAMMAFNHA